jgi:two-component system sensor kinase FixL
VDIIDAPPIAAAERYRVLYPPGDWHIMLAVLQRNETVMSWVKRYAAACLLVAASLLVRLSLQPWLGANIPYLHFFPAIMLAAWYGGFGPGLVATLSSAVLAVYFFVPPAGTLAIAEPTDLVSLILFVATAVGISWFNHRRRAAERASRAATEHGFAKTEELQTILNTAVDGIIVIDARGRIETFNRGAERLFGYPADEVIGRNVSVLMPSPDHEQHDGYLARYLSTREARIIGLGREVTGRRQDGSVFPLHLSVGEMTIAGQRKFTGMLHDLSVRVEHEERRRASEARWQAVIESAVDAIVVIDIHGRIEAFNPAAERLFGHVERELIGQNVTVLMPSPYREEHDTYLARYLATGRKKIIGLGREVTGLRRDGTTFPLHLSVGEMNVDGERRFTGILHDLSVRSEMERQLREQTALARLGEMAAVVAHEVKNPLAGIRGAVQIIGGRLPAESTDRIVIKEIVSRIDALSGLMKDLLVFARPPKPQLTPVDVVSVLRTTSEMLKQDPSARDITVSFEGSAAPTMADASLLQIVFHNLLVNSAQAMKNGGEIRVSIRDHDGMCHIELADTGPGIPPDIREQIFAPFFTTKARGSGLGLPTSRRLIEAHHGSIGVDCPTGGGTTVTVRLPGGLSSASSQHADS